MTITCRCPKCDGLCAFDDKNAGRRARCRKCGQIFIIPAQDGQLPQKVKAPKIKTEPLPGFYHAVFVDSWKVFFKRESLTSLVFVIAVVTFRFFLAGSCCLNIIALLLSWGWLLGFYYNIIHDTAFDVDELPEIYLGTSVTFVWHIIWPMFTFTLTMIVVQLPYLAANSILKHYGIVYEDIWISEFGLVTLLQALFILGLFFFPIAILTVAVGKDPTLLRPDYLIRPIFRSFVPYIVVVFLLLVASVCEIHTVEIDKLRNAAWPVIAGHLAANLGVQVITIISMRTIGLFMRHYSCYFPWQKLHTD
jgi:hypothetical protein